MNIKLDKCGGLTEGFAMARAPAPIFSGFRVDTITTRSCSFQFVGMAVYLG